MDVLVMPEYGIDARQVAGFGLMAGRPTSSNYHARVSRTALTLAVFRRCHGSRVPGNPTGRRCIVWGRKILQNPEPHGASNPLAALTGGLDRDAARVDDAQVCLLRRA